MFPKILLLCFIIPVLSTPPGNTSCPDLYKRFSSIHTYCLPSNQTCKIVKRGVTEKDKQEIVKIHNEFRNKLATGKVTEASGISPAANMLEMIWDDELAAVAQKLTETCHYGHDCGNCRRVKSFSVGQNIGSVSGITKPLERADWHGFLQSLYDEVKIFNKKKTKEYHGGKDGHFTQMMWATTWRVGCGWSLFKEKEGHKSFTVCNYGPGGNVINRKIYEEGPPCSACPSNTCCGANCTKLSLKAKYPGLCKVINDSLPPEGLGPHSDHAYLFFCDFSDQPDCKIEIRGKRWKTIRTPGGNWMSNVLDAGENTTLIFKKKIEAHGTLCFKLLARTGPNIDGKLFTGKGKSIIKSNNFNNVVKLNTKHLKNKQHFAVRNYEIAFPGGKTSEVQYSFNFSVPPKSAPQFIEIKEVSAKKC